MKKKLSSYFLISFLLFFPLLIYSQTIIKEKVTVSPKKSSTKIPDAVQEESQLEFQIGGALPLTTAVVGPTTTQSGSSSGGANPYVYLYFPPLNGNYQITISSTLSAGQTTNVNYVVSYQGQGISYGERWLYNGGEETTVVTTTINVTINSFPEETPVDFSLHLGSDYICSNYESGLSIVNYNQPITSTTNVKFNINSGVQGVELYNKNSGEIITSGTSVHILDVPNLSIRLSSPYQGNDVNVNVTAEIGGVTREDSVTVIGTGNYFRLYSEKRIWDMLEGSTIEMAVELQGESSCDDVRLQDTTKYNLLITQGESFGHIKHPVSGELVSEAVNLPHENGKLKFKFAAVEELLSSEEIVKITVTTTNPAISPYEFVITIHKEGMIVTFVPETIMPGDTASVILKKKNPDGTLSDFPEDQYFDAEIIGGAEYGTLYVPQWGDQSDYLLNIPQGFKFIAEEVISEPKVESTILVRTTAGIIWGRVTPGKTNNQNSVQNTTDDEQLWGSATITIGEGKDTMYVRAYLTEENLVVGDTVEVIVKKVDKDGNETDFPSNTLFEVGIKEGCTAGNILTSSGEKGQYFTNISRPIRFVVNDSLSAADTSIVLRVGVPSDESTIYLPYEAAAPGGKILPLKGKMNSVTEQASDYCVLNQFEYTGFGLASGKIENIKIEITLTGPKEIWPYLPPQLDGRSRGAGRPGYNPFTGIDVEVIKGEHFVSGVEVKLTVERVEGTGGHDHVFPKLPLSLSGKLKANNIKGNPIVVSTSINGKISVEEILSSQFSGNYKIKAELVSKPKVQNSIGIVVKVPGLISFAEINPEGKWRLVGALPTKHTDVHWCTPEMSKYMLKAIDEFYEWSKAYRGSESGIVLDVNDMSLIWGGSYEYNADWNVYKSHSFHRVGTSVDINRTGMSDDELKKLTEIINKNYGKRDPERPQIHYGFLGGN
ncbi:MAG: hypothetical protein HYS25_00445 [Ignavibacteriales bacterium]|nr:hypothetical protein [Ignavibacteriales bacterium]